MTVAKLSIAQKILAKKRAQNRAVIQPQIERSGLQPLSVHQRRLWFIQQLEQN